MNEPVGCVEPSTSITPRTLFRNYGETNNPFRTWFVIRSGATELYREFVDVETLQSGADIEIEFPKTSVVGMPGEMTCESWVVAANDTNPNNDLVESGFYLVPGQPDIGITWWNGPEGWLDTMIAYIPQATLANFGAPGVPFRVWFTIDDPDGEVYRQVIDVPGLPTGGSIELAYPDHYIDNEVGEWTAKCSLDVPNDLTPDDNMVISWFWLRQQGTPATWGWKEVGEVPVTPSPKPVKKGGWLVYNAADGLLYAGKGNKTDDFYSFNPVTRDWTELPSIRVNGHYTRPTGKGTRGVSDGGNYIYLTRGNNTLDFLRFDIEFNIWTRLADVPLGPNRKKVKGGNDMVYVSTDEGDFVYLLKGYKTEFLRYNVASEAWEALPDAPAGSKAKWHRGSWLAFDGDHTIYAHKAKYHELWAFDIDSGEWDDTQLTGLPLFVSYNGRIKRKRSKDGGSAAWYNGSIYSLKGGNTQEFYQYDPETNEWTDLEWIPAYGTTGRKRKVKQGGDFTAYAPGGVFYALKGNKTRELWRYRPAPAGGTDEITREPGGVMTAPEQGRMAVALSFTNPHSGDNIGLNYIVPTPGPTRIAVFDAIGRVVTEATYQLSTSGSIALQLRGVNPGVYLVRLETDNTTASRKLVVRH